MVATLRTATIAVVLSLGLVGCGMMPRSQSTGTAPTQTAQSGYVVPTGYVSGQKVLPYNGRIASKCEHHTSEVARAGCISTER
jgi:hypothetical protein